MSPKVPSPEAVEFEEALGALRAGAAVYATMRTRTSLEVLKEAALRYNVASVKLASTK